MAIPTTTALAPMLIQCLLLISFFTKALCERSSFFCPNLPTARLGGQAGTACARGGSPPPRAPASRGRLSLHKQRGGSTSKKIPLFFTKEGFALHQEEVYTHTFSIISVGIISQIRNIRKQHHFQHHPTKVYIYSYLNF